MYGSVEQSVMRLNHRSLAAGCLVASLVAVGVSASAEPNAGEKRFRFEAMSEASLGLWEGEKPVLIYNHGAISRPGVPGGRGRACYFHPVYGLDGEVITDDFPKDHTYHRGMYWAWPHIKIGEQEYDLWSAKGELRQVFVKWQQQDVNGSGAKLGVENAWMAGGHALVREEVQIEVHPADASGRALDLTLTWTPLEQTMTLWGAEGKSYGGFNFRFGSKTRPVISVPEKTMLPEGITTSAGKISDDLVVTRMPWADFVGNFDGAEKLSGAAIFVHPQHRDYPPTWMARHYGLMSVGWPGVEPQTFEVGKPITCRYRVWIHRGTPSIAEIQSRYDGYVGEEK
jgi:hypothetical protein